MFDVYIRYRVSLYNLNRSESGEGETRPIQLTLEQTKPVQLTSDFIFFIARAIF